MTTNAIRIPLLLLGCVAIARDTAAQPLGSLSWQLTPYCNVLTLAVTQTGSQYRLEGYDDQCGSGPRAAVTGLVVPNPDGTLEFGLTIVTTTSALPAHVDVTFTIATLGGTWRDQTGATGAFVFSPSLPAAGSPRPAPLVGSASVQDGAIGAADINPAEVQRRVLGACGAGTFVRTVNADGTVGCGADSAGPGGITGVTAGPGLTGGGASGAVSLAVAFAGPGAANLAARSDHTHEVGANFSVSVGPDAYAGLLASANTAVGARALRNTAGGANNTAVGAVTLGQNTTGGGNTGLGSHALAANTTGASNTVVGSEAMDSNSTGGSNVAVGSRALGTSNGNQNTAVGASSLTVLGNGNNNTAVGYRALVLSGGSSNIALGHNAGSSHQNGINNIYIDHIGQGSESNTIRIGQGQVETYLAGVHGRTASGGIAVYVNSEGRLGTTTSSRRFKEQIAPLGNVSEQVQALRPVTFYYKPEFDDGTGLKQYGLIAEEVDEVLPDLVVRDAQGRVETVRYHFLNTLLLAEVQRLERERADQQRHLTQHAQQLTQQAREIEGLRAIVDALIQRR
jgi:Chaperone of endosialidase